MCFINVANCEVGPVSLKIIVIATHLALFSQDRILLAEFFANLETDRVGFYHDLEGDGPLVPVLGDLDGGLGGRHYLPRHQPNARLSQKFLKVLILLELIGPNKLLRHF